MKTSGFPAGPEPQRPPRCLFKVSLRAWCSVSARWGSRTSDSWMCGTEAPPGGGHQAVQGACAGLLSVRASRKALFTALSLALFALHLGLLLSDGLLHTWRQTEEGSSHHFTEALLVSHVMSFYWALLGAVYSVESGSDRMSVISLTSAGLNFLLFLSRFWFEFSAIQYREERFIN